MVVERFAVLVAALLVVSLLGAQARPPKTAVVWTGFGHNTTLGNPSAHDSGTHTSRHRVNDFFSFLFFS
jgi:hypothetical protein